jgi:hypothetical protein
VVDEQYIFRFCNSFFFLFSLVVNTVFLERIPVIAFDGIGPLIAHRGRV